MISILPGTKPTITLTPREGFKRANSLERDLIYGHVCPTCKNIIQAFFRTDKEIDLWPYEETTVLSQGEKNMGEILKIVPNRKSEPGETCYRSYFYRSPRSGVSGGQKIVLKNHLMQMHVLSAALWNRDKLWEVGERTCPWTGVFSMREDIAIKDAGMILKLTNQELEEYNIPKISELMSDPQAVVESKMFQWTQAVGNAPPVLLITRQGAHGGLPLNLKKFLLNRFKKPAGQEKQ